MERVLKYIDEHICEKISLKKLADIAGYSPFYFSSLFSEFMGVSVSTYVRIRKLQYAMTSLLEGEKVIDISFKYGFESHEGFTRSFTRLFGSTPKTVRKYLTAYTVPAYVVPVVAQRKDDVDMDTTKNLFEDMHQILFAFLRESINEGELGYCTEINVCVLENNQIRVTDNGRGFPFANNKEWNEQILASTLAGYPITRLDYEKMEELSGHGLQIAASLCEKLEVLVYKNNKLYKQCYIRGIAQHGLECESSNHETGMEVLLTPDKEIFGKTKFSREKIEQWLKGALMGMSELKVNVEG